jgi:hypothetical protein
MSKPLVQRPSASHDHEARALQRPDHSIDTSNTSIDLIAVSIDWWGAGRARAPVPAAALAR